MSSACILEACWSTGLNNYLKVLGPMSSRIKIYILLWLFKNENKEKVYLEKKASSSSFKVTSKMSPKSLMCAGVGLVVGYWVRGSLTSSSNEFILNVLLGGGPCWKSGSLGRSPGRLHPCLWLFLFSLLPGCRGLSSFHPAIPCITLFLFWSHNGLESLNPGVK